MHEVRPKSLGGKVSLENSVAACGSGTTKCHGFAQRNEIVPFVTEDPRTGEETRGWMPTTPAARAWMNASADIRD